MTDDPTDRIRAAVAKIGAQGGGSGMIRVTLGDDNAARTKGLDRVFDAFGATMDDVPKVLESIVPTIRAAHRATFDTEGAAGRGAWAALAPRTLRDRRRLGYGPGPKLVRTGALRDHVLSTPAKVTRRGDTTELRIEPDPDVGGVRKYRALALGRPEINLPGRPMVAVGPASARTITSALQRALRARAAAAGL